MLAWPDIRLYEFVKEFTKKVSTALGCNDDVAPIAVNEPD